MKRTALYTSLMTCVPFLWALPSERASAFPYDVLQTDTLAKDSATLKHTNQGQFKTRLVVLDGEIKTEGTESTIDTHVLINEVRAMQQIAITGNLMARLALPVYFMYEKEEGQDEPRIVSEAGWMETQPRFDLVYATANNLDISLGADMFYVRNYDYRSKSSAFSAHDSYHAAFYSRPHLAIVKHGGVFDAGFTFQSGVEKKRSLTKSNTIDNSVLKFEDVLFEPTTVSVFMRRMLGSGTIYAEFAAVEASGGGNKTSAGATSEEDYFKVQLGGAIPLASRSLVFEPTLIYKSLSYADNRNVTLATIPGFALHLDLNFDNSGLPLFVGGILVKGTDGQSLREFNAKYKVFGYGGVIGLNWGF